VVDRQLAGLNVDLSNRLTVDRHLEPLTLVHLLVAVWTAHAVEATALLPRTIVKDANVSFVFTACEFDAR
jgi:hypothetical protein